MPEQQRRGERGAPGGARCSAVSAPASRSPCGQRRRRGRSGVSGSSGRATGSAVRPAGSIVQMPSSSSARSDVEGGEVLDEHDVGGPFDQPRRPCRPEAAPATRAAARCVATSGPGTSARPSSSNTSTASDMPSRRHRRPRAGGARTRRCRPARARAPGRAARRPRWRARRRWGSGRRGTSAALLEATWSSVSSKSISVSFGQAEDALADDVALHLRRARRRCVMRQGVESRPCTWRPVGSSPRSSSDSAARSSRRMARSPSRWRSSEYASLNTMPPTPHAVPCAAPGEMLRLVSAQSASSSAAMWPSSRRRPGVLPARSRRGW